MYLEGSEGILPLRFRLHNVASEGHFVYREAQLIKFDEIAIEQPQKLSDNDLEVTFNVWNRKCRNDI